MSKTESNKLNINQKIELLDQNIDWFHGEEFALDLAIPRYKETLQLATEIKKDLENLENEIKIIDKDFSN